MEDKITKLIEKFYAGNTSAQEENNLREWLKQSEDTSLKPLREYFALIDAEQVYSLPENLEKKIIECLKEREKNGRYFVLKTGIAASIALLITAGVLWKFDALKKQPKYSEAEIQQSYTEAKAALITMSAYFNNGMRQLSNNEAIEKPFYDLQKLSEIKPLKKHEHK